MSLIITSIETEDIRFPTSKSLDGSDAMHKDPDYSAAYVTLKTNNATLEGHGLGKCSEHWGSSSKAGFNLFKKRYKTERSMNCMIMVLI